MVGLVIQGGEHAGIRRVAPRACQLPQVGSLQNGVDHRATVLLSRRGLGDVQEVQGGPVAQRRAVPATGHQGAKRQGALHRELRLGPVRRPVVEVDHVPELARDGEKVRWHTHPGKGLGRGRRADLRQQPRHVDRLRPLAVDPQQFRRGGYSTSNLAVVLEHREQREGIVRVAIVQRIAGVVAVAMRPILEHDHAGKA